MLGTNHNILNGDLCSLIKICTKLISVILCFKLVYKAYEYLSRVHSTHLCVVVFFFLYWAIYVENVLSRMFGVASIFWYSRCKVKSIFRDNPYYITSALFKFFLMCEYWPCAFSIPYETKHFLCGAVFPFNVPWWLQNKAAYLFNWDLWIVSVHFSKFKTVPKLFN